MSKVKRNLVVTMMALLAVLTMQFGMISVVHAAGEADLNIWITTQVGGYQIGVCNDGPTSVKEFTLDTNLTNLSRVREGVFPAGTSAQTQGSYDSNSGVWTGLVQDTECVNLVAETTTTGDIGQAAEIEATILSSVLEDDTPNTNLNTGNDTATSSYTIVLEPDIVLETRLSSVDPVGDITPTSVITYDAKIKNVGPGTFTHNGFLIIAFVIPDGASLDSVTDSNTSDNMDLGTCTNIGPISGLGFSALAGLGGDSIFCDLPVTGSGELPVNSEYLFEFKVTAGNDFANGDAEVVAIVEGNDRDTVKLFLNLAFNENPLSFDNDNFQYLAYDPNALRVTVSRCPGQGETTTNGTGCFILSFNKKPYAPEFTADDIVLTAGQQVDEFTQLSDTTWRIVVSGIKQGTTFTLTLKENSVQDYSAVLNDVKVLGENTIRFENDLPETGKHVDWITPLVLIGLGFILIKSRKIQKRPDIIQPTL